MSESTITLTEASIIPFRPYLGAHDISSISITWGNKICLYKIEVSWEEIAQNEQMLLCNIICQIIRLVQRLLKQKGQKLFNQLIGSVLHLKEMKS